MLSLKFENFDTKCPKAAQVINNGNTVDTTLSNECPKPQITGGPLPHGNKFVAESFHFHWGSKNIHGSEHIVNNKRHAMEAHIVHRNGKYATVAEARKHSDGLAVLGIFYDVDKNSNKALPGLQRIVKTLQSVENFNFTAKLRDVRLNDLLGNINTQHFYTYQGSLTTPPCSQAVTWILFPKVLPISNAQMKTFRLLKNAQGGALVNNYRFLQPKGKREVYFGATNLTMQVNDNVG
ncbi:carbonic anhydrase 2 [Stomoxys calcitrans]|uniref:carbonic anhydrase 2 n=1 Tax=Stomoxys calcitrans TaxID=35570 RepID=UPI0027E2DCFF|nr:carbonic anhydrase 2 [Stomoxys calcitrans]